MITSKTAKLLILRRLH